MSFFLTHPGDMAAILLSILMVACYTTYKIGVRYGFDDAVKTCAYEHIVVDNTLWVEAYSINFQQLARLMYEHIRKEHHCQEDDKINVFMLNGPKSPGEVREMQETIFQLYEKYRDTAPEDIDITRHTTGWREQTKKRERGEPPNEL